MAEYFLGQIILTSFNRAISGWALCDGRSLPIQGNEELFDVIGTRYGGDGVMTFNLPALNGRLPIGIGLGDAPGATTHMLAQLGGSQTVTLGVEQIPAHTHPVHASSAVSSAQVFGPTSVYGAGANAGTKHFLAPVPPTTTYAPFAAGSVVMAGGGKPHDNLMPGIGLCYQICLDGIYAPQS